MLKELLTALRRFDVEAIYNTFLGLPPRQQTIALVSVGAIALLVLVLPLSLASSHLGGLEDRIAQAQQHIETTVTDVRQFTALQGDLKRLEERFQRQSSESLLTLIQRIAGDVGVTAERPAERGRESLEFYEEEKVSFYLKGVPLEQLVQFLHKLENATERIIRIKELVVAPVYGNRQFLNAEFKEVAAYRLAAAEDK